MIGPSVRIVLEHYPDGHPPTSTTSEAVWVASTSVNSWTCYGHGSTPNRAIKAALKRAKGKHKELAKGMAA